VYPDHAVATFINENFQAVRVHVREQPDEYKRLGERYAAPWTPTILILDRSGEERHRIEGFLPSADFLSQLELGLAHSAFKRGEFTEAMRRFGEVVDRHPATDAAPEALYWMGVAKYKASGDAAALAEITEHFRQRYQETSWAKKASVWGGT
jgi:TolA-binding protein